MNSDTPPRPATYPALSGEVWDNTTGLDERTTGVGRPRAAKADPVTENSQPMEFTSGDQD
jgi:hypothetical protein